MRRIIATLLIAFAGTSALFAQGGKVSLNTYTDSVSYLIGMEIARNLQVDGVQVNVPILSVGAEDAFNGTRERLTLTQRTTVLLGLQARARDAEKSGEKAPEQIAAKLYGEVSTNPPSAISTLNDSLSYSIGFNIGDKIRQQDMGINASVLVSALRGAAANNPSQLTEDDVRLLKARLESEAAAEQTAIARNKENGEKFLQENAKRSGVVTLPSGLQYEVLKEGTGPKPTVNDKVTVHYHGTLIDGTVFDSSVERGEPVTFPLNKVIKGWIEGLQLMPEGSKWKLYIPAELAYGARGAGQSIAPNSALIFEVELISITR